MPQSDTAPDVREGFAPYGPHQTWYRITGDLEAPQPPLVVAHGGPGATHDYLDTYGDLACGRAVIHYDQVGNGRSTHLPDAPDAFWTVAFFKAELHNLIDHLGIRGAHCLLGQSWGGMLAAEYAVDRPSGLSALVIADSPADMETWVGEANRLRAALPADVQATLLRHEAAGTTGDPQYVAATQIFYDRHVCRVSPMPPEVARSFAAIAADPTVYQSMNGPSEFHVIGSLRTWSVVDRLAGIEAPTLLLSGRHDEATPACVRPFLELVPDVRWHVFGQSSHMPHVEEREECMAVVDDFLTRHTLSRTEHA